MKALSARLEDSKAKGGDEDRTDSSTTGSRAVHLY